MNVKKRRVAWWMGALSIGVALLTALSLIVNHIEFSLSARGEPPDAGDGSIESTHLQAGFRDARLYVECVQWKRNREFGTPYLLFGPPGQWDWLIRLNSSKGGFLDKSELNVNGWVLTAVLGIYPGIALVVSILRRLREKNAPACPSCRYDLTGNLSGVCPECGAATPDAPSGKPACDALPITPAQS